MTTRLMAGLALLLVAMPVPARAQATGTLAGKITDTAGKPISGATIRVLGTSPARGAISKPNGSYLIAGLRAGEYDIEITAVGYISCQENGAIISAGETTGLNLTIDTAPITVDIGFISTDQDIIRPEKSGKIISITHDQLMRRP